MHQEISLIYDIFQILHKIYLEFLLTENHCFLEKLFYVSLKYFSLLKCCKQ